MRKLFLLLLLLASSLGWAQAGLYNEPLLTPSGVPAVNAPVRVCAQSGFGTPCNPVANIYSESSLSSLIAQPGFGSDPYGNVTFYAAAGFYQCQATYNGIVRTFPCAVGGSNFTGFTTASPLIVGGSGLPQTLQINIPNSANPGTTLNRVAKIVNGAAQNCTTTDTAQPCFPIGAPVISGGTTYAQAGTSGNAPLVLFGQATLTFDTNGGTAQHYVGVSTVAAPNTGIVMDLGASVPVGTYCLGQLQATVAPNQSGTVQLGSCNPAAGAGYTTIVDAVSGPLPNRTKLKLSPFSCVDNAGASETDCSQGAVALINGTDNAPSLYIASQGAPGTGEYLKADTLGGNGMMWGHGNAVWMRWAGGIQFPSGVQIGWDTANFASFLAGICRSGVLGEITIDAGNCGTATGVVKAHGFKFDSFCNSSISPAVCSNYTAGYVVIAAGATTVQVNTTAVSASSMPQVTRNNTLGGLVAPAVTCNTQSSLVLGTPYVSAVVGGTSFTISVDVAPTANPLCLDYTLWNN